MSEIDAEVLQERDLREHEAHADEREVRAARGDQGNGAIASHSAERSRTVPITAATEMKRITTSAMEARRLPSTTPRRVSPVSCAARPPGCSEAQQIEEERAVVGGHGEVEEGAPARGVERGERPRCGASGEQIGFGGVIRARAGPRTRAALTSAFSTES